VEGFSTAMKDVDSQLGNLEERGIKFGEKFAEALSFAEITKSVFEAGEEFENAMVKIERATGAAGEPLQGLEESFAHTFGNVVQGADDVAGGLALLSQRTGATGEDLDKLLEVNSKLAQVLGEDLKPTIEATQKVFTAFKTSIEDQPEKLDALLAIAQKSGVSFNTLVGGLQTMGPTLRALGLDMTDSAALLANFEEQGISTGKVAGTLNATLVSLAKEGFVDPKAALGEFLEQIISAKDPTEALQLAAENFKGKGLIPLVDALQNGAGNLAVLRDAAANSKGRIEETADSTQTLSEKFKLLEGATTKLLAPIGVELVAALGHMTDAGTAIVKIIDSVIEEADKLDKAIGTDVAGIKKFADQVDFVAGVLINLAVPSISLMGSSLKGLGDQSANNKFIDGTMANGLKTISEMFPEFGKNVSGAGDKFVDLDKNLKEAEKDLSEVEKAVRLGIGTDEDAAAARLKVVAAMQALHPEMKSIFAETDSWNSIVKISDDLIGEQNEALLKLAPTISAHTALLESQAISLKTRADLWPIDMQGIQDQAEALTASSDALSINNVNMKGFDDVLKLVQMGLKDEEKAILQTTAAEGPLHNARLLGINDGTRLQTIMEQTHAAYLGAISATNAQGGALYSLHQQQIAQISDLKSQIDYYQSIGKNTTNLQIQMDGLVGALARQRAGWVDLGVAGKEFATDVGAAVKDVFTHIGDFGSALGKISTDIGTIIFDPKVLHDIRNAIDSDLTTALKGVITGVGDVGAAFAKLGTDVLDIILNKIIGLGIQQMLNSLAGVDGIVGKIGEGLGGVASKLGGLTSTAGAGGLPSGVYQPGISDIPKLPGFGGDPGGIPGVGDAPGIDLAGAGGAGSSASSFTSVLSAAGAIGGVVSAISGIIGNFQNARQEGSLNAIESNTRVGALYSLGTLRELEGHSKFYGNSLFPELKGILDWQGYIVNSITALGSVNMSALPGQIATALTPVLKTSAQPITININGAGDPAAVAQAVAAYLKTVNPSFA